MQEWRVTADSAGLRLDKALADFLDVSRNQVQLWIREGRVRVDGELPRASLAVAIGNTVTYAPRAKDATGSLLPEAGELSLLYQDADLLIVDKPAGIAIHPGAGRATGTLAHHLLHAFPELASVGGTDRPGIVHRLDIDTTGVLAVARTERAYRSLSRAFAERAVVKRYLAVVFGVPREAATIELPIGRHPVRRKEMTVRDDGRPARTTYRTLAVGDGVALLELGLETGRTHQIRVHLKAIRHPLVGDATYAGNRWRGAPKRLQPILESFPRPALHAAALTLDHPISGLRMDFEAPVPADLEALWHCITGTELPALSFQR